MLERITQANAQIPLIKAAQIEVEITPPVSSGKRRERWVICEGAINHEIYPLEISDLWKVDGLAEATNACDWQAVKAVFIAHIERAIPT